MPEFTNKQKFEKRISGELAKALEICMEELDVLVPPDPHEQEFLDEFMPKLILALERDGKLPTEAEIGKIVDEVSRASGHLPGTSIPGIKDSDGAGRGRISPWISKNHPHLMALVLHEFEKGNEPPDDDELRRYGGKRNEDEEGV